MIYLDNATEAKTIDVTKDLWGEKSSAYGLMQGLAKAYEEVDARLRSHLLMDPESRYFITSSWEDIPKTIIRSCGRKKVGVFLTDSNATLGACDEARGDIEVHYLRSHEEIKDALLFVQYVHPLTGVIFPQEEIESAKKRDCLLALDISYAMGKVPLNLELADYVMVRGAALGTPFGLSCAAARGTSLERRETGFHQLRAFTTALEQAIAQELFFSTEVARLKAIFEQGENVLFADEARAPHISCLRFEKVKNELLLFTLARREMFATIGGGPFPLLERMLPGVGISYLDSMTALSFCMGSDISEKTISEAKERLKRACKELQVISEGI
jgi:cysteine sulfinate desulfinase/cysteine desulfurase-like protein